MRLMHGPEGVSLMDETNIPAISTKQQNHPCGGFFVCGAGVDENPHIGFTKIARSNFGRPNGRAKGRGPRMGRVTIPQEWGVGDPQIARRVKPMEGLNRDRGEMA